MATWTALDVFAPARVMLAALTNKHVSSLEDRPPIAALASAAMGGFVRLTGYDA